MIEDVEVRAAGPKGKGVFALRSFRRGEFIFRRRHGRVVRAADIGSLSVAERRHLCELDFDRSAMLLPPGAFLNHSCEPNAMRSGVKVFAWRGIRRGEEITIDYRLNAFGGERSRCLCRASSCTGWIVNSFFALDASRHAPTYRTRRVSSSVSGVAARPAASRRAV